MLINQFIEPEYLKSLEALELSNRPAVRTNKDFKGLLESILVELNEGRRPVDGNNYVMRVLKPIAEVDYYAEDYYNVNFEKVHFRKVDGVWEFSSKIEYV